MSTGPAPAMTLRLRVERGKALLHERVYRAEMPANGSDVAASVGAFDAAIDTRYAQLLDDLRHVRVGPKS